MGLLNPRVVGELLRSVFLALGALLIIAGAYFIGIAVSCSVVGGCIFPAGPLYGFVGLGEIFSPLIVLAGFVFVAWSAHGTGTSSSSIGKVPS